MPIKISRHALFFSLVLSAQLVCCVFENLSPQNPRPSLVYDDIPTPGQGPWPGQGLPPGQGPPIPTFAPNQPVTQPYSNSTINCQKCTISVSVSPHPIALFPRSAKTNPSQSPYTTGLRLPQTQLVSPRFPAHPRLQFPLG